MKALAKLLALGAMGLALGCGGGGEPTQPGGGGGDGGGGGGGGDTRSVTVGDNFFNPSTATVAKGTTVTWTFGTGTSHNVTFDDGEASGTKSSGTYSRAFATAGSYPYHCTIHGPSMSGTVVVQ